MKRAAAFLNLILCLMFFSACLDSSHGFSEDSAKNGEQKENTVVPPVCDEPVEFNNYALQAEGSVYVKGTLETEGPLADIYSGNGDAKIIRKGSVSGNIYSSKNSLYKTAPVKAAGISKSALNKNDLPVFSSYYLLHEDGTAEKITEGYSAVISAESIPAKWNFSEGTWKLAGSREKFSEPMVICGNLHISGNPVSFYDQIYVTGNITSEVYFEVSLNDPFSPAIVSGGNMNVQALTVTGKIETGGDLFIGGSLDITGSIAAGGNILVEGNAKIGYYDTMYKAALASAREEFDQEGEDSEIMLVHSQIFKNLKGQSEVAMFTFAKGYRTMTEDTLLMDLKEGYTDGRDYFTRCCGASMNYGTVLSGSENLSEYYRNKLHVLNWLSEAGHDDVTVTEALYIPTEKYYLTFADSEGKNTGTYLISAPGMFYDAYDIPVELTEEDRLVLLEQMNELENAEEDIFTKTVKAVSNDEDEERNTDISTMTDEELAELGLTREIAQMTAEEMRTEEWRRSKIQYLETEEVEAEKIVWEKDQSKKIGKKLKRAVKKVTKKVTQPVVDTAKGISNFISNELSDSGFGHFCANVGSDVWNNITQFIENDLLPFIYHTEWHDGFIKGVENGTDNDRWTKEIHMINLSDSCGPISAAMILNWHDKIHYDHTGDYLIELPSAVAGGLNVQDPFDYYKGKKDRLAYLQEIVNPTIKQVEELENIKSVMQNMKWIINMGEGEIDHNTLLSSIIEDAIEDVSFSGQSKFTKLVSNISSGTLAACLGFVSLPAGLSFCSCEIAANRLMFNDFRSDVYNNQPGVIGMYGYYKTGVFPLDKARMEGHYMPVIGYKYKTREVFNIDTVVFDELYLYTDTTWKEGKKFYRVDEWSKLDSALGRIKVRVYDDRTLTVEQEVEYTSRGSKSEGRDWFLLINGKYIPDKFNYVLAEGKLYSFRQSYYYPWGDKGYVLAEENSINDCFPDVNYTLTDSEKAAGWCKTGGKCTVPDGWVFVKRGEEIWAVRAKKLEQFAEEMQFTPLPRLIMIHIGSGIIQVIQ